MRLRGKVNVRIFASGKLRARSHRQQHRFTPLPKIDGHPIPMQQNNNSIGTATQTNDQGNEVEAEVYRTNTGTTKDSWAFLPQNSSLTRVGSKTFQKLNTAFGRLGFALESGVTKECQENVLDQIDVAGLNVSNFIAFLDRGANFYNGEKSTATVAGNVGPLQWSKSSYGKGATISGVFSSHPGTMALSSFVNTTLTVFFREGYVNQMSENRLQAFMFHEALHAYGQGDYAYMDEGLKLAFGIDKKQPSEAISDYIYKHCFK
jgi:hypothetical protein